MQQPLDSLVFNRTAADVAAVKSLKKQIIAGTASDAQQQTWFSGTMPGAWNYTDLNRIEEWTVYLQQFLIQYGYTADITSPNTAWTVEDYPTQSEIDRIRTNVDALQNGFYSIPDWQDIVYNQTMNFSQANALEWDLQTLYNWLQSMVEGFLLRQANTIFMTAGGVFNNA